MLTKNSQVKIGFRFFLEICQINFKFILLDESVERLILGKTQETYQENVKLK